MYIVNINNIIKKSSLCILFFIYIYPLKFNFFPFSSTRITISVIGILLFIIDGLTNSKKKMIIIRKEWLLIFSSLIAVCVIALSTNLINGTTETYFITFPLSMIAIMGASYAVVRVVKAVYHQISFDIISRYIIISIVFQMILTVLMFMSPFLKDSMLSLLTENYRQELGIESLKHVRIIGFGSQFFAAGVVNCFTLILLAILIKNKCSGNRRTTFLKLGFILVSIVGTMMSRTTLIGILLSFAIFSYKSKIFILKSSTIKLCIIFAVLVVLSVYFMPSSVYNKIKTASRFGFEMFYNYFEKGELTSKSTKDLSRMFDVFPQNLKTWIIGDGYYSDPFNRLLYYMNTDVGYARLLFYFGTIGLLAYFTYQIALLKIAYKITENAFPLFFFTIAILLLILNLKGTTDMTSLVSLFIFCERNPKFVKNGQ